MKMSAPVPQIILYNGILVTQSPAYPHAQAIAVGNGKILALGPNEDVLHLVGPGTTWTTSSDWAFAGSLATTGCVSVI